MPNITTLKNTLVVLRISHNDIGDIFTVHPNLFEYFPNLSHLYVAYSKIYEWPNVTSASNLVRLDIKGNQISVLPNMTGLGFPVENNLKELYLSYNTLSHPVAANVWVGLPKLEKLTLTNCGIAIWPNFSFASNLILLALHKNFITDVPSLGFPTNNKVKELLLQFNNLSTIEPNEWNYFPALIKLNLHSCHISTWPNLTSSPNLQDLYLHANKLTALPSEHGLSENLKVLYLQGNNFGGTIPESFVNSLPKLRILRIHNIGLTQFPRISSVSNSLTELYLGGDAIGTIDPQALIGQDNFSFPTTTYPLLTRFYMPCARLQEFPDELFTIFPNIKRIDMHNQLYWYNGTVPNFTLAQNTLEILNIQNIQRTFLNADLKTIFHNMFVLNTLYMRRMCRTQFPFPTDFIVQNFPP